MYCIVFCNIYSTHARQENSFCINEQIFNELIYIVYHLILNPFHVKYIDISEYSLTESEKYIHFLRFDSKNISIRYNHL